MNDGRLDGWSRFQRLWVGQTVSQLGTAVTVIALPLVAVLQLHASTLDVGAITGSAYAAYALFGLPAGVYIDRWKRRRVMLFTDATRALALAAIPACWGLGVLRIWELFVLAFIVGVLTLFFDVAYQAYLPTLLTREQLIGGNARVQGTTSVAQLAGPGIAGVLVQLLGAAATLVVDAASYVISFFSVLSVRGAEERHQAAAPDEPMRMQLAEGFSYIRRDPILVGFLGCVGHFNILITAEESLFVVFLVRSVHVQPALIGVLLSGMGVGAVGGAVMARRVVDLIGTGRTMFIGAVLGPAIGILIPFTYRGGLLTLFVIGTAGLGATQTVLKVVGGSYRQAVVPPHLLGRVVATFRTLTWGPLPLGGLLGGGLGQLFGPRVALLIVALGMAFAPLWLVVRPVWRLTELIDAPVSEPTA